MEKDLYSAYAKAWNNLVTNRDKHIKHWEAQAAGNDPTEAYYANRFMSMTDGASLMTTIDLNIVRKTLEHVDVKCSGTLVFHFIDGSKVTIAPKKTDMA